MGAVIGSLRRDYETSFEIMTSPEWSFIKHSINTNKVVIFSKTYCPFSALAKEQFRKLSVETYNIELDTRTDGLAMQTILREVTGSSTVPQVFIDGKYIGGGTDVEKLYKDGSLKKYFEVKRNQK